MAASTTTAPDRRRELIGKLDSALGEVLGSGGYQHWLDCQAKFHGYSFANCVLIAMQCRQATRVAGYRKWQELGRYVRKGEHAIYIWAPSMRKVKPDERRAPAPVDSAAQVAQADEAAEYRLGFVLVPVFDVSQTDGEPLPELAWRAAAECDAALISALSAAGTTLGYRLELGADIEEDGLCMHEPADGGAKLLRIKGGLGSGETARALAHELAHALLHGPGVELDRARRELEADSAAYVVLAHFGLDCAAPCASYLAAYNGKQAREVLKQLADRVQGAAAKIIDAAEVALTPYESREAGDAQAGASRRAA